MPSNVKVRIDITQCLHEQLAEGLDLHQVNGEWRLGPSVGEGDGMTFLEFPDQIEFYHFGKARFAFPVEMKSVNPADSDWFLIHVNLSNVKQHKTVDGQTFEFQKHLPIGILLYGPGLEIDTLIPPDVESELASIRFPRSILDTYLDNWRQFIDENKNLIYEDLDYILQDRLGEALLSMHNKMLCHAAVLTFLHQLFQKLATRDSVPGVRQLRSSEVDSLFLASTHLRDPLSATVPSLDELASIANMSVTKFKSSFKQIFGSAPIQYRNKIRMEYAREEIVARRKTPTEVSYILGYSHPSNFTSAYKKFFGELPSEAGKK